MHLFGARKGRIVSSGRRGSGHSQPGGLGGFTKTFVVGDEGFEVGDEFHCGGQVDRVKAMKLRSAHIPRC
jgi:hypothetical protein